MNSLLSLLLFSCLVITCYSAVFFEPQFSKPGHKNECYDKENNVFYKSGEQMKWNGKICGRKICRGSDGRGRIYAEIQTCGKIDVPPVCKLEVDLKMPYPNCCGRLICPELHQLTNTTRDFLSIKEFN